MMFRIGGPSFTLSIRAQAIAYDDRAAAAADLQEAERALQEALLQIQQHLRDHGASQALLAKVCVNSSCVVRSVRNVSVAGTMMFHGHCLPRSLLNSAYIARSVRSVAIAGTMVCHRHCLPRYQGASQSLPAKVHLTAKVQQYCEIPGGLAVTASQGPFDSQGPAIPGGLAVTATRGPSHSMASRGA
eukprot:1157705-Pelagomonas_calceolata.AAC.5